jgi:hypothetical protein
LVWDKAAPDPKIAAAGTANWVDALKIAGAAAIVRIPDE